MHLIYESVTDTTPIVARYLRTADRSEFAHDLGHTLIGFAEHDTHLDADCTRLVLHDDAGHAGSEPDDDASSWLASWSQAGWERFDTTYRRAKSRGDEHGVELLIQPSCVGMLSDAISTLNWCTRGGGQDATLLLDPMGWVVPSMLCDLQDHLVRINDLCLEMVGQGCVGLVLVRSLGMKPLIEDEPVARLVIEGLAGLLQRAPAIGVLSERDLGVLGR